MIFEAIQNLGVLALVLFGLSGLGAIGWAIYWSWPAPKPKRKQTEVFTWWPEGHVHIKRGKR